MAREVLLGGQTQPVIYVEAGARSAIVAGLIFREAAAVGYTLTAASGALALTGSAASLSVKQAAREILLSTLPYPIIASEAADRQSLFYLLTLTELTPTASAVLGAARGTFTATGQAATLRRSNAPTSDVGTFALTGQSATFVAGRNLRSSAGAFVLTIAGVIQTLEAFRGSFDVTRNAANLIYNPVTEKLSAAGGVFSLTSDDVDFFWNRPFTAAAGTFAVSGQDATFTRPLRLYIDAGNFTFSGRSADFVAPRIIAYPIFPKVIIAGPS